MANNKQWLPNKINGAKSNKTSYPFDGGLVSGGGSVKKFQFSSPGLINGMIPDNMWGADSSSLFSVAIPSGANTKWYIVAECFFNVGITSATIKLSTTEPKSVRPVVNVVPPKATIILYYGIGTNYWKAIKGNILVKPMLVLRNYIESPKCGALPFKDYYTFVTIS